MNQHQTGLMSFKSIIQDIHRLSFNFPFSLKPDHLDFLPNHPDLGVVTVKNKASICPLKALLYKVSVRFIGKFQKKRCYGRALKHFLNIWPFIFVQLQLKLGQKKNREITKFGENFHTKEGAPTTQVNSMDKKSTVCYLCVCIVYINVLVILACDFSYNTTRLW